MDAFLTVDDVAKLLKLNPQTVRNWIDRGELPAVRVGRRVRIRASEFAEFVEKGRTSTHAGPSEQVLAELEVLAQHAEAALQQDLRTLIAKHRRA